jgi:hypothetical protein
MFMNNFSGNNLFQMYNTKNRTNKMLFEIEDNIYKVTLFLMLLGIIANMICICVFLQKKMLKIKYNWYLLVLAIFQLFYCLVLFFDHLFRFIHPLNILLRDFNKIFEIIIYFSINTSDSCLVLFYMILSIDRLYCIRNPHKIKTFITQIHAKRLLFTTILILLIVKIADFLFCSKIVDKNIFTSYCTLTSPIMFNIGPTALILLMNLILIKEMISYFFYKADRFIAVREMNVTYQKNQTKLTVSNPKLMISLRVNTSKCQCLIILALSIWLVLTTIPFTFSSYYFIFRIDTITKKLALELNFDEKRLTINRIKIINSLQTISSIFFYSNHCINLFVYILYDPMFRSSVSTNFLKLFKSIIGKSKSQENQIISL